MGNFGRMVTAGDGLLTDFETLDRTEDFGAGVR